jgi:hypothetical protein
MPWLCGQGWLLKEENYHTPLQTAIGLGRKVVQRFAGFYQPFIESIMPESKRSTANLKKYREAAIGFVLLNVVYLILTYWKVPSFGIAPVKAVGYLVLIILFIGTLATFVYRGSRILVIVLAAVYAGRALFSVYALTTGTAFPLVRYVLPTTVIGFYLFGRVIWNWP